MSVNQKMFAEVHQLITEFPELHFQGSWQAGPEARETCGTTRCTAGWAVWLGARNLGLVSRKRHHVNTDMLRRLAQRLELTDEENESNLYLSGYPVESFPVVGAALLGLTDNQAERLFHDYNQERVLARVKSFAETGEDLSEEERARYDMED